MKYVSQLVVMEMGDDDITCNIIKLSHLLLEILSEIRLMTSKKCFFNILGKKMFKPICSHVVPSMSAISYTSKFPFIFCMLDTSYLGLIYCNSEVIIPGVSKSSYFNLTFVRFTCKTAANISCCQLMNFRFVQKLKTPTSVLFLISRSVQTWQNFS